MRKKEQTIKKEEIIVTGTDNQYDAKILKQLAEQSLILVTQFDAIEKKIDKTIEILNNILKIKKIEMGIYE